MNCEAIRNIEDLYMERRLTAARAAQVEAHLKGCSVCTEKMRLASPLAGMRGVKAPKDLKDRMKKLLANLETTQPASLRTALSVDSEFWPAAATIAISLVLAVLLSWAGPGVPSQSYMKTAATVEVTP
jgi:predicted anti-sigma-YlaC factor YlaD